MRSTRVVTNYTERREQVARLYLEGKTQTEIAAKFDVTQATISRDLEAIRQQWVENALVHFDQIKARELARIDKLERENWQAWERSQKDAETVTKKMGKDGDKQATIITKGQVGDPQFLRGVQWCIEQRLKIYGVYEAVKLHITDWRSDIVTALQNGDITTEDVKQLYPDLASDFFAKAGVDA